MEFEQESLVLLDCHGNKVQGPILINLIMNEINGILNIPIQI